MSLFQSSVLTLALAFASALASIAGYVVQIGAVDPSTPPAPAETVPTESPLVTIPSGPTPATTLAPPNPVAISARLPKGVDWNAGDLLVLVSGFDLDLVTGSRFLGGLVAIDKNWAGELVGGSIYAVDKSACRRWGEPPTMPGDFFSSGQFPEAMESLRADLGAIRGARAGAGFRTLVVYYSSVAPEEAELKPFDDATLYWCGRAVEDQRNCKVLNRLFPRPRFTAGGTADQSAPNAAFESWRTAVGKK